MAIPKLILVFVAAVAHDRGITAPNAKPPIEQLREQHVPTEHAVPLVALAMKIFWWAWAFLEGAIVTALSGYCPPNLARPFLHALPLTKPTSDLTKLTPAFLVGSFLTISGSILRLHCYRALGPRFTFQLSIRPTHTLVTDGVYAIIRHPSYTGLAGLWLGYFFCVLDPQGSVVSMLGRLLQTTLVGGNANGNMVLMGVLTCAWATAVYPMCVMLNARMKREDTMLERNFGDQWRAWAKRVPYWVIPGVY